MKIFLRASGLLCALLIFSSSSAQHILWSNSDGKETRPLLDAQKGLLPKKYRVMELDLDALTSLQRTIPREKGLKARQARQAGCHAARSERHIFLRPRHGIYQRGSGRLWFPHTYGIQRHR